MAFQNLVFETKYDANEVLKAMKDILEKYEVVTVADYRELSGLTSTFPDSKIGWTDLTGVKVESIDRSFTLNLPIAKEW